MIEETARWLVVALGTNVCKTDLEKAQAIVSLSRFAVATGERGAEYNFDVALGDQTLLDGELTSTGDVQQESVDVPITDLTAGKPSLLSFSRDFEERGRMYYTMNLRYVTPAQDIEALNRGFAISHEYSLLDDADTRITSAHLGDVVRVHLTVMVPSDSNYVLVEDFLPAGLEPIDPSLAVVEPALKSQLQQELAAANRPDDLAVLRAVAALVLQPLAADRPPGRPRAPQDRRASPRASTSSSTTPAPRRPATSSSPRPTSRRRTSRRSSAAATAPASS